VRTTGCRVGTQRRGKGNQRDSRGAAAAPGGRHSSRPRRRTGPATTGRLARRIPAREAGTSSFTLATVKETVGERKNYGSSSNDTTGGGRSGVTRVRQPSPTARSAAPDAACQLLRTGGRDCGTDPCSWPLARRRRGGRKDD